MQFGKAEQDAFILDFNPTGERRLGSAAARCVHAGFCLGSAVWQDAFNHRRAPRALFAHPFDSEQQHVCAALACLDRSAPPPQRPTPLPPAPPAHLVARVPSLLPPLRSHRPPLLNCSHRCAAVLTAFQAFAIVLSTFDSKVLL